MDHSPLNATEVWLYGSSSRGVVDSASDLDVLVVGREDDVRDLLDSLPRAPSVMEFAWDEIAKMAAYGSLFLHHIRLEGTPLTDSRDSELRKLLDSLPPYQRAEVEIACFEAVIADVRSSIRGDHSCAYELAVLAASVRHMAILACYLLGKPMFGRVEAMGLLLAKGYISGDLYRTYLHLYAFRLADERGRALPAKLDMTKALDLAEKVTSVVDQINRTHPTVPCSA